VTRTRCVPVTQCEIQTIQCVKRVCEKVCRQEPYSYTVNCPQTVTRQVIDTKMVCVPRTVCKQVPVEVCVRVPVVYQCPEPPVLASSQSVVASPQGPVSTIALDPLEGQGGLLKK
jgi:hypothetical protein